jgi:undecaprenyl diphosphate synthase
MLSDPNHIAIIMDGNRRWAKRRGVDSLAGHKAGADVLRDIARHVAENGMKWLTVFAFSSENWQRSPVEVRGLMRLISQFIKTRMNELIDSNVRLRVVGRRDRFSADLQALIHDVEARSAHNNGLNLTVALDYGGCQDIVHAASRIAKEIETGLLTAADVTDDLFKARLSTRVLPPVDLLIRSGGETRISNFLLWEMAYAELYFTDRLWPDFTAEDLAVAIANYRQRDRRFGVSSQSAPSLKIIKSDAG